MKDLSHPLFKFVGGEHDAHRTSVTLSAVNIPEVAAHENTHERIFNETCDGSMLASAVRIFRAYDGKGKELPAGLSEFVDLFCIDDSKTRLWKNRSYICLGCFGS